MHRAGYEVAVGEGVGENALQPRTGAGPHAHADDPLLGNVLHGREPLHARESPCRPVAGREAAAKGVFLRRKTRRRKRTPGAANTPERQSGIPEIQ